MRPAHFFPNLPRQIPPIAFLLSLLAIFALVPPPTRAQEPADLKKELDAMKKEYADRVAQLEARIAALEKQPLANATATDPSATALPPVQAVSAHSDPHKSIADLIESLQGQDQKALQAQTTSDTSYTQLRDSDTRIAKLEEAAKSFEFHSYFRSGYGFNERGGQQIAFQAPGAGAKFRLGNEAETYGELIFVNNWINPQHDLDRAWLKTEFMVEANTTNSANFANFNNATCPGCNDQFRFREAFVQAGNILKSDPDAKFWAGERYYRRYHIDIDDFYILDMSGYGAGVEDLRIGPGKLALAVLGGARPDITTTNGNYAKGTVDVRFYGFKVPGGEGGVFFDYADAKGGTQTNSAQPNTLVPSSDGYSVGFRHTRTELFGGFNSIGIIYSKGAASNLSTSIDDPTFFIKNTERLLIAESLLIQPNDRFAIMPLAIYQRTQDGNPAHGWAQWVSFGARPVFFLSKHMSLAFEPGFDRTTSANGTYNGWLRKFTLAPQIGAGRQFFSRPVLRLFVTYANWSEGLRGFVGGPAYSNRTSGLTYGVQTETWF